MLKTIARAGLCAPLAALALFAAPQTAAAQDFPTRPVHLIVPFAPGGVTDIAARVVGQKLAETWGQQVVVENRPGAGGTIGVDAAVRAAPDGYTLLMATNGEITINPALYKNLTHDPQKDLIPIAMVTNTPLLWAANANAPYSSLVEFIAAAKAKPGDIAYSSPGAGTMNHLTAEWFATLTGTKLLHVPYKGGAPAAAAIAGGEVPVSVLAVSSALPHVKSGKVKVLGMTTQARTQLAPDWPSAREAGIADFDASIWVGLFAPKGTPADIVAKVTTDLKAALADPAVVARLNTAGAEAVGLDGPAFLARIKADTARYGAIVKAAGIEIN
ncbi:tripartite tricarboxylate transporter substrate binding protein [Xanthobacter sp. KR7-225]|uniref:Bug family tripartite tricarboxylate transporter substrate binding protein n=1 Tax=Xanthobacter sp. KR7-225 TaxID=3156613 RepID=UPI0032B5E355